MTTAPQVSLKHKMRQRGIIVTRWRGCPHRMFTRMGVFISLDGAADLRRARRYRLEGNDVKADLPWYAELRNTTEAIRDELSRQRCAVQS